jgi:hypothetical protein
VQVEPQGTRVPSLRSHHAVHEPVFGSAETQARNFLEEPQVVHPLQLVIASAG